MICGKCQREFVSGRMGVIVKFVRKDGSSYFRRGDEACCPGCGSVVVSSMGESYSVRHVGFGKKPDFVVKA